MMTSAENKARYFWPCGTSNDLLYDDGPNQRIRTIANNLWKAVRDDPSQYGGFSSENVADKYSSRSLFLKLANILWVLVPHAGTTSFRANGGMLS